jgi:hypothetical protein
MILLSGFVAGTAAADPAPAAPAPAYGTAGCGLGSMVFGSKPGLVQILALTSNETLGSQLFGITSGTSNCGDTSGGTVAAKSFIESNREAFAKDVSRGSGETIANLATLGGCADARGVAQNLQRNFKQIFPSARAADTEISAAAIHALASDKTLACTKLG